MRILHSWLQRYINVGLKPEQLAERLGMLGLEVEGIERLGEKLRDFVVGRVRSVSKHPNADKLSVCLVDVGGETIQVVCGAQNVANGQMVAVGRAGATVPRNQHDPEGKPFVLSNMKIRGVESSGMICSEFELNLGKDADGIMVLDSSSRPGQSLAEYFGLNDIAYDVEITPNRPDWLSHYGVAREIGVIVRRKVSLPIVRIRESRTPVSNFLSVKVIDGENCLRFASRMIRGIQVRPSPRWLQNALRNVGLRPRNNVVDVTNFVMLECGQPLHAFDYALLRGNKLIIRKKKVEGKFKTLDGKEHDIPKGTVMVCDGEREVSIAGIMGGANSEINEGTVDIVLESACWNPGSIRRTRRALGVTTDASQRFERGSDPGGVLYGLQRATQLVCDVAGGEVLRGTIDILSKPIRQREIPLRTSRVNSLLGTSLNTREVTGFLSSLGIASAGKRSDPPRFRIPTYRVDLEREVDLVEEVARVYGYDKIEEKTSTSVDLLHPFQENRFIDEVRQALVGFGFHESLTYSLQDANAVERFGFPPVRLMNPQTAEYSALRTSIVHGLLTSVARNLNFGNSDVRLFEIGRVYRINEPPPNLVEGYVEEERIGLAITGNRAPRHWSTTTQRVDFFEMKGEVLDFLQKFALDKRGFISYPTSNSLADSALALEINGRYVGYFGEIKEEVLREYKIEQEVFIAELSLDILQSASGERNYVPPSRYPRVRRDIAFVVEESITGQDVEQIILNQSSPLLHSVELFDVYRGENLAPGKKSLAFGLDLMSSERTLTDEEVEAEVKRIVRRVVQKTGGSLRAL